MIHSTTRYLQSATWLQALRWSTTGSRAAQSSGPKGASVAAQQVNLAFHRAYERFAQSHPHWVQRRFDDHLLRPLLTSALTCAQPGGATLLALPTAASLAAAWDRQFGILASGASRVQQQVALTQVAHDLLCCFQQEWERLAIE